MEDNAPRPQPVQQAEAIKSTEARCREDPVKPGTKTFLIGNKWFSAWCQHSGFTYSEVRKRVIIVAPTSPGRSPGPIDSSDLLAESQRPTASALDEAEGAGIVTLRSGLVEKKHFWALCEPTWDLLKSWYGLAGPEIVREYMQVGLNRFRLEMDPCQLHIKVTKTKEDGEFGQSAIIAVSELCTVANLMDRAANALGGTADDYEILDAQVNPPRLLEPNTFFKTLRGVHISDQQLVLLRPKKDLVLPEQQLRTPSRARPVNHGASTAPLLLTGSSPMLSPRFSGSPSPFSGSPLSRSGGKAPGWAEDLVVLGANRRRGLAGLGNLGNTCFMNSSVQCLVHTLPIMEVFLTGAYKRDCNADNPLGLGGKLACAFGGLVDKLWRPGASHVSPKHFKWRLAKFAPQFQGYAQQDSQELLAFLLDGLHEDLNRIRVKPYVEEADSEGRPDAELAAAAWSAYRSRNDSVIVDHFQGMYKSTLVCPSCGNQSVKFDPFMYLSLPLPTARTRDLKLTVLSMDGGTGPMQYSVTVPKSGSVGDVHAALSTLCLGEAEVTGSRLVLTKWTPAAGAGELHLLTDPARKLAGLMPARAAHSYSLNPRTPHLLAYLYEPEAGPGLGRRAVLVHHRANHSNMLPPSLLFASEEELAGLQLARISSSNVGLEGTDNLLAAALLQSLRPFHTGVEPVPAEAAEAHEPHAMAIESTASAPIEDSSDDARASSEEGPADVDMEECKEPEPCSPSVSPLHGSDDEPFDMFAEQKTSSADAAASLVEEARDAAAPTETSTEEAATPPLTLKLASQEGRLRYFLTGDVAAPPALPADDPLSFVADWSKALATQYDRGSWDAPVPHASVLASEEAARKPDPPLQLQSCMEAFLQMEQLDAEDSWYCSKCKQHVQANKKLDLWSLPEVLVVHLKRFSYSRASRDKLDAEVSFPFTGLDLGPHMLAGQQAQAGPLLYDLYAVSNHYGGLGGGHYTAYCKMPDDGRWYLYDDSSVREVAATEVQSSAAYVLFYRRQGSKVALQEIFDSVGSSGAGASDAHDPDAELGEPSAPRPVVALDTIDSEDELMVDPLHEELDIEPAASTD